MKPETLEWIAKAEGDLGTASREVAVVDAPNFDAVCFHSQQSVELAQRDILSLCILSLSR
jgi:HEPN domain-containing protein